MNNEQWIMNNEQWIMNNEQWIMNNEQWIMNNEQWAIQSVCHYERSEAIHNKCLVFSFKAWWSMVEKDIKISFYLIMMY